MSDPADPNTKPSPAPEPDPQAAPAPEPTVGTIVDPAAKPSLAPVPSPEELAKFAPPPPIAAPAPAKAGFPHAPEAQAYSGAPSLADRSVHSGLVVGHVGAPSEVVGDAPAAVPAEPTFEELPQKIRDEILAGYRATHGGSDAGFDPANFRSNTPAAPRVRNLPIATPVEPASEPTKLSAKTLAEIEGGRQRLAEKRADYDRVKEKIAGEAADKLEEGAAPDAANMSYAHG